VPEVRLISREQLADEYRAAFDQAGPDLALDRWSLAMTLFELMPREQSFDDAFIDSAVASVAAYYSSASKDITVVEDSATTLDDGTFFLSHEFVHALQDQREGLRALQLPALSSTDATVAIDSLTEGEATWLSNVVFLNAVEPEGWEIDLDGYFDGMLEAMLEGVEDSDAPLIEATSSLPYPVGGRGVGRAHTARGPAGIEDFYGDPPETLAAWLDASPAGLPRTLSCDVPPAPPGYALAETDRLGVAGLLSLWTRLGLSGADSYVAAQAWTADAFAIYAPQDEASEQVAAAWRIRLTSAAEAGALADSVRASLPGVEVVQEDLEALLIAVSSPDLLTAWSARGDCPAVVAKRRAGEVASSFSSFKRRSGLVPGFASMKPTRAPLTD
jgi:hypothetical protein